jgi:hypothetical protein
MWILCTQSGLSKNAKEIMGYVLNAIVEFLGFQKTLNIAHGAVQKWTANERTVLKSE